MIYTIGALQGVQKRWMERTAPFLVKGDIVLAEGDFGFGEWKDLFWSEEQFLDWLQEQPYTVCLIGTVPQELQQEEFLWHGGSVQKIRSNVLHLQDGEVYTLEGTKVFVCGKNPSCRTFSGLAERLKSFGREDVYAYTSLAPKETMEYLAAMRFKEAELEEETLPVRRLLDEIASSVRFGRWIIAELAEEKTIWQGQCGTKGLVRELKSGRIVSRW